MDAEKTAARQSKRRHPVIVAIFGIGVVVMLIGRFTMPFQPFWMDLAFIAFCVVFIIFMNVVAPSPEASKTAAEGDERAP